MAHCSGKPPPHTQARFPGSTLHLLQQTGLSQLLTPTWASQEWPLFSQSLHLQNLTHPGRKPISCPSPVPVANPKEEHGAGCVSSKDFPCHGKPQQAEQPPSCFFLAFPIPENLQGQVGWNSEQPDLVGVIPVHGRRVGT